MFPNGIYQTFNKFMRSNHELFAMKMICHQLHLRNKQANFHEKKSGFVDSFPVKSHKLFIP